MLSGAVLVKVARPLKYLAIISQFSVNSANPQRDLTTYIDIVGPLPYADGFKYLLTCVDCFTRWPGTIPLVDIRAETVAYAFFSGWIAQFGTSRGAQFESKLWDGLCNQFGIVRNRTTSYHPQSNGMVERLHRQLKAAIMAHESPNPWTIALPAVFLGARSAVKEVLGR